MMQSSGEFRRYADEQVAENTVVQRRVQNALRDAAARIDALEKRCLELDAACCEYERQRDEARREVCELRCNPPEPFIGLPHELAKVNNWCCFPEVTP